MTRDVVWLVEDDRGVARALEMWLSIHGVACQAYPDAESALEALQAFGEGADGPTGSATQSNGRTLSGLHRDGRPCRLVGAVVDLNLPKASGISVLQALRQRAAHMPLVLVTALPPNETARHGAPPLGVVCLKKPFELDALEAGLFGAPPALGSGAAHGRH
jgi:DNA-binding response OmpR family regulator